MLPSGTTIADSIPYLERAPKLHVMAHSRRHFLQISAAFGLGFAGLHSLVGCGKPAVRTARYGPLQRDPNGILDLPAGFSYKVIARAGQTMSDGFLVPGLPDGMATFSGPDGLTILVRNHEVNVNSDASLGAFGSDFALLSRLDPKYLYDAGTGARPCLGGVTTLVYNTRTQSVQSQHLSLAGSLRNCAGGPTPWKSWITCEETFEKAGAVSAQDHGYCFEVPASASPQLVEPVPLKAMGRFVHEAVAVDPATGIVFLTEDDNESLIYRFIPDVPGQLSQGGRLQALVTRDVKSLDTRNWDEQAVAVGQNVQAGWIDLQDTDPPEDDLRLRGFAAGAARFARGEGMWYADGKIYFACTSGGQAKSGQIWLYEPADESLTLFVEADDSGLLNNADNLTVAPWGHLVVCEDSAEDDYLVGITPEGAMYRIAHNVLSTSELAGAVFSPDGSTLFVNLQRDGLTLAITGPWT